MKALVIHGPGKISFETVADAQVTSSKSALVKASQCGLCGSDLHPYHVNMPHSGYCMGHEAVGEVVETGADVKNFKVGDRVIVSASIGCGNCRRCLAGEVILCENTPRTVFGQGLERIGGCQAEAIEVPFADNNLFALAPEISDEVGIMLTDNLPTAWFGARRARVGKGDVVAVIGLGPVGLQCVMSAIAMGAERVLGIDLVADRRREAVTLGAEAIENPDSIAGVLELTAGRGADVVLDANGSAVTTELAIKMLRQGGRVSVVGVSEQASIPFPILEGLRKNFEFHAGICSVQAELPALFKALENGLLDKTALAQMVTHKLPLSLGSEAYALFDARKDGVKKIVFDPCR
ncbi:MAG: alcohol dehydrogenase catalytic domain-containing protein [Gammaproteobacteria bacterium]|nr:alcohol dehydrogenase catalytic domain-containing protein [Gammaproteobacteria bacterium]